MSYNATTGIITAPVSIADVRQALEASSYDLGTLCKNINQNIWARYRSTNGGSVKNRKKSDGTDEDYNTLYPISVSKITTSNFKNNLKWSPIFNQTYYRLHDFNGYNKKATNEFDNSMYRFLPATNYGSQNGIFYNSEAQLIFQLIPTNNANTNSAPQCWEDATSGMSLDTYSSLRLENISTNGIKINNHNIYDHMIGLAIIVNNTPYLLSTGVKLSQMFGSNNTAIINITKVTNPNETVNLGTCYYGGQKLLLYLNFKKYNDVFNATIFPTNNNSITIYARAVLIWPQSGETGSMFLKNNLDANDVYSFELSPGFCSTGTNGITLNRLLSYVNILDTNRNAGNFFDSDINNGYESANYVYQNGNWVRNSGHPAYSFTTINSLTYIGHCNANGDNNTNGIYSKYRLKLQGAVCNEFRPKYQNPRTAIGEIDHAANAMIVDADNVYKQAKLSLKLSNNGNGMRDVYMKIGSNASFLLYSGSGTLTTINTGDVWGFNYVAGDVEATYNGYLQIKNCDKLYGSDNGYFYGCHSQLLFIDGIVNPSNNNKVKTQEDYVYVWIQNAVASSLSFDLLYDGVSSSKTVGTIHV